MKQQATLLALCALLGLIGSVQAASPPEYINYQGVLRDASDRPLDGSFDMIFRFYSAPIDGTLLLLDGHTDVQAVPVSRGLFDVAIGSGAIGPGVYPTLAEVFANETEVYLEVQVGSDLPMMPRILVVSTAYALNAQHLEGRRSGEFLDVSAAPQTKFGKLVLDNSAANTKQLGLFGIEAYGSEAGGYFKDSNESGYAMVGYGHSGIHAYGNGSGGYFQDLTESGYARLGTGDRGIEAYGDEMGGRFWSWPGTVTFVAFEDIGIWAQGNHAGAMLYDADQSGRAFLGYGDDGIYAEGNARGGYFKDLNGSGYSSVGTGDRGIEAHGDEMGGRFTAWTGTHADVAFEDMGIFATGNHAGAWFKDADQSGEAYVGYGNKGIEASGNQMGGHFQDSDNSGYAYLGYGDIGIFAFGDYDGAHFVSTDPGGWGVEAYGGAIGGHFTGDDGIYAEGPDVPGAFHNPTSGANCYLAWGAYKLWCSSGGVSFVQNHPEERDRIIVYTAPEGDEVATYTRGTAMLSGGLARVSLGETFKWVTNPDVGLTAYVTPRGDCQGLYVDSLTTDDLVVRELGGGTSDVVFDFVVYGLRIGFEELPVVQTKTEGEAYIPDVTSHIAVYDEHPGLRRYNALERFRNMFTETSIGQELDLTTSQMLRDAIGVFDPTIHSQEGRPFRERQPSAATIDNRPASPSDSDHQTRARGSAAAIARANVTALPGTVSVDKDRNIYGKSFRPSAPELASLMSVAESVESGDVLVIDAERSGLLKRSRTASDTAAFGVVAADPGVVLGAEQVSIGETMGARGSELASSDAANAGETRQVPVAMTGLVKCKADASYGEIRPGDLLSTSPTPGHAMRVDDPQPGTILGKALEPLEVGTGLIRILVTLR